MTTYVTFTEINDNEGETWRSYIPTEGNEEALRQLELIVDELDWDAYDLDLTVVDESAVDDRVAHLADDTGYMPAHTKLSGRLVIPSPTPSTDGGVDWGDLLYKGSIQGWMQ